MREFSKVSPLMWRNKRFCMLSSSDAKLAMLYFVTCEHQNSAGCYRLPDGYAASDLTWDVPRYEKARTAVVDAGLIAFDPDTSELFVCGWFETNPAMNPKHAQSVERRMMDLESDLIREQVEAEFSISEEARESRSKRPAPVLQAVGGHLANTRYLNRGGQ